MRSLFVILGLTSFAFTVSAVDYHWTGVGWYQVMLNQYGSAIGPGPYTTEEICESSLPENDVTNYIEYECNYLDRDGLTDQ